MKKIKYFTITILATYLPTVQAINGAENINGVPSSLSKAVTTISNTILGIVGTLAVLFLIIGGFQYVTSAGNPDSISKAKSTILYAILGIVFAILAFAIISYITTNLV